VRHGWQENRLLRRGSCTNHAAEIQPRRRSVGR
jgi:hypothetical protein